MILIWLITSLLGGQNMVMPNIDWRKVEEIAETNPVSQQKSVEMKTLLAVLLMMRL